MSWLLGLLSKRKKNSKVLCTPLHLSSLNITFWHWRGKVWVKYDAVIFEQHHISPFLGDRKKQHISKYRFEIFSTTLPVRLMSTLIIQQPCYMESSHTSISHLLSHHHDHRHRHALLWLLFVLLDALCFFSLFLVFECLWMYAAQGGVKGWIE